MSTTTAPVLGLDSPNPPHSRTRTRWQRWVLGSVLALVLIASVALFALIGDLGAVPPDTTIDGTSLAAGLDVAAMPATHKLALAVLAALAVLSALLLALAVVAVVLVALVPLLLLTVGLPVLAGVVLLLALLSPFAVLAWCLWRMLRPRPATIGP